MTSKNIYSSLHDSIVTEFLSTFNDSKYTKWYLDIVTNPDPEGEEHHILPRSLFPKHLRNPDNLVILSLRKHYMAHLLLMKMGVVSTKAKYKLFHALKMMSFTRDGIKCNSRLYEKFKIQYLEKCYKLIFNESTGEERQHFIEDEIPDGFVLGGKPKSDEWKESRRGHTQSEDHIKKRTGNNKGKTFWVNPETNECTFSHEPPDESWIKQSNNKGKTYGSFERYYDPITLKQKNFKPDQEIPEGWVKGIPRTEETRKRALHALSNANPNNKDRTPYYDPITLKQKNFKPDQEIPEGWVKGRTPLYSEKVTGVKKQTDLQKQKAREANQKTYKVTYLDGTEEIFTGMKEWIKSQPFTKSQLDYCIRTNYLQKYNILKLEEL